jgi:WD40 repeat protein
MSRAAIFAATVMAATAIAAPPRADDPPWLIARLGNDRFRQTGHVSALTYSADDKHLASGDGERIHIWDAADGRRLRTITIANHEFFALRYSPDSRTLFAAGTDDRSTRLIRIDPTTGKIRSNAAVRAGRAEGVFSADGAWLALRPKPFVTDMRPPPMPNSLVHVVNVQTGSDWTDRLDQDEVASLVFRADSSALAVGTGAGRVWLFNPKNGKRIHELALGAYLMAFTADGKDLIGVIDNPRPRRIARYDGATGKVR